MMQKKEPKVYLVRAGSDGEDEDLALENGIALIGFPDYPSLAGKKDYDSVLATVNQARPDLKPRAAGNYAGQLWAFACAMEVGDIVVLPRKTTSQIALGRVLGPYEYRSMGSTMRHVRPVQWIRPDTPRSIFAQDLLNSFGAFMTVCNVARNGAARRISEVLAGKNDPELSGQTLPTETQTNVAQDEVPVLFDLGLAAHDQIVGRIQARFKEHRFAELVNAVLIAEGWTTKLSPPGPDGGVDILAGRGSLGLDAPRLCVQVKSQTSTTDVTVYRGLQGSMQSFKADQGLLVCWGGFNKAVLSEARQGHFSVRLWDSGDLVEALYRTYENLPAEIQAELPLKRVWMLVQEDAAKE